MASASMISLRALSIKTSINTLKRFTPLSATIPVRYLSCTNVNKMKFVQFKYKNDPKQIRVGYVEGDKVVDLNKADSSLPTTLLEVLRNGDLDKVKKVKSSNPPSIPLSDVTLAAPITNMDKVICIGLNYKDHCQEQALTPPIIPMFFSKWASTVIGPNEAVKLRTKITKKVDWEIELTVVIGKKASNVKKADAYNYVLGYTVAQDISGRDWQKEKNGGQFLLGKSQDTFCPIGPWIVTHDEISDPQSLKVECKVNGAVKQQSNTNQLIHKIPDAIERLSSVMTLLPGDIILTGTPGGVGQYRQPPEYLQPGHTIESTIEKIGTLVTKIEEHRD